MLLTMNGCSQTDTPAEPTTSAEQADAAYISEHYHSGTLNTGTTIIESGVTSSCASAVQAISNMLFPKMQVQTGNLPLPVPDSLLLSENPFEKYGILHNQFLNVIARNGGVSNTINGLAAYDSTVYFKFFNASTNPLINSDSAKSSLFNWFKSNDRINVMKAKLGRMPGLNSDDKMIEFIGLPVKETNELKEVFANFKSLKDQQKTKEELCTYLNKEITKIIAGKEVFSKEEETQLIYITVLKHSAYYWN